MTVKLFKDTDLYLESVDFDYFHIKKIQKDCTDDLLIANVMRCYEKEYYAVDDFEYFEVWVISDPETGDNILQSGKTFRSPVEAFTYYDDYMTVLIDEDALVTKFYHLFLTKPRQAPNMSVGRIWNDLAIDGIQVSIHINPG